MYGLDDTTTLLGEWMTLSPSPRMFGSVPLGLGDDSDLQPNAAPYDGGKNDAFLLDNQEHIVPKDTTEKYETPWGTCGIGVTERSSSFEQKSARRGLVERMAARAGFSAPRLNTERIKSSGLSISSEVRSPYLTIPPGLSPTTFLESPILLSDVGAQQSPTTGQFPYVPNDNKRRSPLISETYGKSSDDPSTFEDIDSSVFAFKPAAHTGVLHLDQARKTNSASLPQQLFPSPEVSVQADTSSQLSEPTKDIFQWSTQQVNGVHTVATDEGVLDDGAGIAAKSPSLDEQQDEGDEKGSGDAGVAAARGGAPSEDGYNWRKYGQKQVKGSEYPRSYYKCTHPNCQVKKKVERSPEGYITEIIYKGKHDHIKPPPNRRSAIGSSSNLLDLHVDSPEQGRQHNDPNGDPTWGNTYKNPEKGIVNIEVASSATMDPEFCNPTSSFQPHNGKQTEPADAADLSSTFSNDEETHGSASLAYDGEGDESESKRSKLEVSAADMGGTNKNYREPRVVVQTISDVDILDDGYRWRKYGQKVVKGNPNPRSYYKCTSQGCNVRKHVERASNDLKSVITTYEGKHNHDVPAARNTNYVNSTVAAQMNQAAAAAAVSAQSNIQRPESAQVQNGRARFERPPSFSSFCMPGRPLVNPHGYSFGMNQGLANIHMAGLGSGQSNMHFLPTHQFLSQPPMNDIRFMLPREPKSENMPEPGLNMSASSYLYQQLVGNLPLGPQM